MAEAPTARGFGYGKSNSKSFADETGLTIVVCHYPPGTSKWNKIEHRLFCHITQNWRGRPLTSRSAVVELIAATTTKKGLTVRCELDPNSYIKGVKVSDSSAAIATTCGKTEPFASQSVIIRVLTHMCGGLFVVREGSERLLREATHETSVARPVARDAAQKLQQRSPQNGPHARRDHRSRHRRRGGRHFDRAGRDGQIPPCARSRCAPGLAVAPAFGADDEDCTFATRRQILPNGRVRINREFVCEQ